MLKNEEKIEDPKLNNKSIDMKKENDQESSSWKDYIPSMIYGPIIVFQLIFVFFTYNYYHLDFLMWIGWGLIAFFFLIGGLPRQAFKEFGEVEKGKSHYYTTKLVDKGIYAIIRHPYWSSWIIISLSFTLMSQHWLMVLLGIPAWIIIYLETFLLDIGLIKKFGKDYKEYRKRVPRMNPILGTIKYLFREKDQ